MDFTDVDGLIYSPTVVREKMNRNAHIFPDGWSVMDDSWHNLWVEGPNAALGWDPAQTDGNGLKSFGKMIASSDAFSQCMVKKAFQGVCLRDPIDAEKDAIKDLSDTFKADKYNMKNLFASTAALCVQRDEE
jgi:hypothetical protein